MTMIEPPLPIANDPATGSMEHHLLGALQRVLPRQVRIATAYLTPDGFLALEAGLSKASTVQLLLGERPFMNRRGPGDVLSGPKEADELRGPAESVDWYNFLEGGYPWLLLSHQERAALLERGEDKSTEAFNLAAWARVRELVSFLKRDGVEVRRFLGADVGKVEAGKVLDFQSQKTRLHAKAYLFAGEMGDFAAVGSSNLTRSGLGGNAELNLATYEPTLVRQLEAWFDAKWGLGQDCKQEFIQRLEECVLFGRRYTPWQVFLKSLHAAYGRFLELGLSEDIADRLAGFQQHAVQRCITLLERHWGAMLCDSVGLGKTYEGLGILGEFARRREGKVRALVVCPAQLEDNWNVDRFVQYGIQGETATMESLPQLVDLDEVASPLERDRYERRLRRYQEKFDIVLVDESHNFRNSNTKRYRALMEMIRGGIPDKRVVLVTATPVNNSIWDLYNQLMLMTRGDDTWYAGRGPISNLQATFQAIEKGGGGSGLLDAMMLSLVRRTRHDIRAMQQAGEPMEVGGQPLRFPEHEIPQAIGYSLQNLYGDIYRDVIDAIENLNFAVYQLESYGVDTGERETAERLKQRNANFVGIMRTILLKRMESSVAALKTTVGSLVEYLDLFLARLDKGRVITPKQAYRLRAVLGGSLPDQEQDVADWDPKAVEALRTEHDAPTDPDLLSQLRRDATEDRDRLKGLLDKLAWLEEMWGEKGDPKALEVRKLLESLPATDQHGLPTKVVIFTNYRDTAQYLFRQLGGNLKVLGKDIRVKSNLSNHRWTSLLTGSDDQKRRRAVLEHFAPLASFREAEPLDDPALVERVRTCREKSIELLIATDVLSEGQNLQDAQYVINYDLHWNPVRMIQRAGRIDRLLSPHEKVYIYNVMPEQGLEDLLKLVKSLTRKLETIEDAVALDASVLGEQIEARQLDKIMRLRSGGAKAEEVYLEGERNQGLDEGLQVLNQYLDIMKKYATEDVAKIPNGVYSIKKGPKAGVYVMLKMPEEISGETFWRFYPLGDVAHPDTSPNAVIGIIQASPDEMRLELTGDVNPFSYLGKPLQAAVAQVGASYLQAVASQTPSKFIAKLKHVLQRDDLLAADKDLWKWFNDWAKQTLPSDALKRRAMADPVRVVNRMKVGGAKEKWLVALSQLRDAIQAEGLDRPIGRPDSVQPSEKDLELVAWELVVGPEGLPGNVDRLQR
ncbi:MAG: helicase-related protein [Chloroflexota bacterium]